MKKLVYYYMLILSLVSTAMGLRIISEIIRYSDPPLSLFLLILSGGFWIVILVISLIPIVRVFTKF